MYTVYICRQPTGKAIKHVSPKTVRNDRADVFNTPSHNWHRVYHIYDTHCHMHFLTLKIASLHDANFVIIGGTMTTLDENRYWHTDNEMVVNNNKK